MNAPIVEFDLGVTLVGRAPVRLADLRAALRHAPEPVAVDGGLARLASAGIAPRAVIGDMDSAAPEALAQVPADRVLRIAEQETTDFDKALRSVAAPLILGVGFTGRRLDHSLAALSVLAARGDAPCLLVSPENVVLALPPVFEIDLPEGSLFSLFPMAPVAGRSDGLRWPIEGIGFSPAGRIGTSNRVTGPVRIEMEAPGMLAVLPRRALAATVRARAGVPGWG